MEGAVVPGRINLGAAGSGSLDCYAVYVCTKRGGQALIGVEAHYRSCWWPDLLCVW